MLVGRQVVVVVRPGSDVVVAAARGSPLEHAPRNAAITTMARRRRITPMVSPCMHGAAATRSWRAAARDVSGRASGDQQRCRRPTAHRALVNSVCTCLPPRTSPFSGGATRPLRTLWRFAGLSRPAIAMGPRLRVARALAKAWSPRENSRRSVRSGKRPADHLPSDMSIAMPSCWRMHQLSQR